MRQFIEKPPVRKTTAELVKDLDKVFSHFIRLRDVKDHNLGNGYVSCCTCGYTSHWLKMQNGHYVGRQKHSVRWNEMNCNTQCKRCNKFEQGNLVVYRLFLIELYGKNEVEKLDLAKKMPDKKHSSFELLFKIAEYKEKVAKLKKELGL